MTSAFLLIVASDVLAISLPATEPSSGCKTWVIDISDNRTGKKTGSVFSMKDDKASKMAAAQRAQDLDRKLCKGMGPQDSTCYSNYGQPYCADHVPETTAQREARRKLRSEQIKQISKTMLEEIKSALEKGENLNPWVIGLQQLLKSTPAL